jgi:hypothetical protein
LKIYLLNLNSKTLDEEGLADLFQCLPRRCIVLLEDVDSAGITHTRDDASESADVSPVEKMLDEGKTSHQVTAARIHRRGFLSPLCSTSSTGSRPARVVSW